MARCLQASAFSGFGESPCRVWMFCLCLSTCACTGSAISSAIRMSVACLAVSMGLSVLLGLDTPGFAEGFGSQAVGLLVVDEFFFDGVEGDLAVEEQRDVGGVA